LRGSLFRTFKFRVASYHRQGERPVMRLAGQVCRGRPDQTRARGEALESPVNENRGTDECVLGGSRNDLLAPVARSQWRAKKVRAS